jgi:hypothetical protein
MVAQPAAAQVVTKMKIRSSVEQARTAGVEPIFAWQLEVNFATILRCGGIGPP